MPENVPEELSKIIETLYRAESGRILATLVRLLGDLDVAEEAMHEAFAAALDTWTQADVPDKPCPWLISTARFKAINGMRRRARFDSAQKDLTLYLEARISEAPHEDEEIEDDCLLGKIKNTEQADQSCQDSSRIHAIKGVEQFAYLLGGTLGHDDDLSKRATPNQFGKRRIDAKCPGRDSTGDR